MAGQGSTMCIARHPSLLPDTEIVAAATVNSLFLFLLGPTPMRKNATGGKNSKQRT